MSEKIKKITKNTVIVILLLSSAFLTWLNWFSDPPKTAGDSTSAFSRFVSSLAGRNASVQSVASYNAYTEYASTTCALYPSCAVVRSDDSLYLFTRQAELEGMFERVRLSLSTALDTARDSRILTSSQWRDCLCGKTVFLEFAGDMPLYYLASSLGAAQNDEMDFSISCLALDCRTEPVRLAVKTTDGEVYCYDTDLRNPDIESIFSGMEPSDVTFACENESIGSLVPAETLITKKSIEAPRLSVSAAVTDFTGSGTEHTIDSILASFGFNTYSANSYIESDTTRVYVEEMSTLRISPAGILVYDKGSQEETKQMSAMSMSVRTQNINRSAQIVEKAISPLLGEASSYILRQYYDKTSGNYVVVFSTQYAGMKIDLPAGYLARFEYRGTELVNAYVNLLTFSLTEEYDVLMPGLYAAAAGGPAKSLEGRYVVRTGKAKAAWYLG